MADNILLKMQNIKKSFSSNPVLKGVNLEVEEGKVVALLGENGAGKSTLIKILGGIYRADEGQIYIHGQHKEITSPSVAGDNGIRIIHQEIFLVQERSIAANVFLGREVKNRFGMIDLPLMEKSTQNTIDSLKLNLKASQKVSSLTMGMQQLVEIIKAVSAEARIVVMDEPTSSLSQGETETLFHLIQLLKEKGVGIIYISHRLEELFEVSDKIVVLRDGIVAGEVLTDHADKDELIRMMVGRELSSYYTRTEHPVGKNAIEVRNLSHKDFFQNCNFYVKYGEIVGFAGLVGAGRTELMKTIFGSYTKMSGEILLDGEEITIKNPQEAIKKGIVYVSEDRRQEGLILNNDVKFNMGLVCINDFVKSVGVQHKSWNDMVEKFRKKFSIKFFSSKQTVSDLSGGNQQKVVLSKWLSVNPGVIILDEPTRGIDVGSKAEIYAIIDELALGGAAIIIISSELPEIINMCNRCYVMCEGRITGELDQDEFTQVAIMKYATDSR